MISYKKQFIWRVIITMLLLGILIGLAVNLLIALMMNVLKFSDSSMLYITPFLGAVSGACCIFFAAIMSIKGANKKCMYQLHRLDDEKKFFVGFILIMIGIVVIYFLISFSRGYKIAYFIDKMQANYSILNSKGNEDVQNTWRKYYVISSIISEILQVGIIAVSTPLLIKIYRKNAM